MSTPFTDIYLLNEIIKSDNRLINKTTNQIYALYFLYLTYAISYFESDCYKNLTNYISFSQQEYSFTSDGVDKQYLLSPTPPSGCEFYVGYRLNSDEPYLELLNYSFSSLTNILTINDNILANYEVYVSAYIIGQFNEDLNMTEKRILSNGMLVPYDQEMLQKQSLLSQMIYGGSTKLYSQSNHIKEIKDVVDTQYYRTVKAMINEYSFKQDSNNLLGLGGGN